jgi:hypothetical protein
MCQGYLVGDGDNDEQILLAVSWMMSWMLDVFHGIRNEQSNSGDDEPDAHEKYQGPHDNQRCQAGIKGTCRRCNERRQHN